ncbi:Uncharacterised protein [Serratia fonticola]|nr:Uncharacterised protein [Serratia fonticola]
MMFLHNNTFIWNVVQNLIVFRFYTKKSELKIYRQKPKQEVNNLSKEVIYKGI